VRDRSCPSLESLANEARHCQLPPPLRWPVRTLIADDPLTGVSDVFTRFANKELEYNDQKRALKNLVQAYLSTFNDLGIETWLVHGTLLGWWWNKKVCHFGLASNDGGGRYAEVLTDPAVGLGH
jgi:hypothetical protein